MNRIIVTAGLVAGATLLAAPVSDAAVCTDLTYAALPSLQNATGYWGDFDADGDPDLLVSAGPTFALVCQVFRNDAGQLLGLPVSVPGRALGWADVDGDGDLDFLASGASGGDSASPKLHRNDSGVFVDSGVALNSVSDAAAAFADFDGDGDLDLAITGGGGPGQYELVIYENQGGDFRVHEDSLPGTGFGDLAWGDLDTDGDPDLCITGISSTGLTTTVFRNDAGQFVDAGSNLPGFAYSSCAWGDFDLDGDDDLAIIGTATSQYTTLVYRNDQGALVSIGSALSGFNDGDVAWGDFDGDGDLDLAISGASPSAATVILVNDGGAFSDSGEVLPQRTGGSVDWADFDGDADLDLLLAGVGGDLQIVENDCAVPNTLPSAPTSLAASAASDSLIVSWVKGIDGETPQEAVGSSFFLRDESDAFLYLGSASANPATGARTLIIAPNAGHSTRLAFDRYEPWLSTAGVQSVDSFGAGSAFATVDIDHGTWSCFSPISSMGSLHSLEEAMPAPADYDGDGDQDLAVLGVDGTGQTMLEIYENDAALLTLKEAIEVAADLAVLAWVDEDGDGDLDLALTTKVAPLPAFATLHFYHNEPGGFVFSDPAIAPIAASESVWGDFDGDGDQDLVQTGHTARVLRRDPAGYSIARDLSGTGIVWSAAWGDFDGDFDLDLALAGTRDGVQSVSVLRNDAGQFTNEQSVEIDIDARSVAWIDYDNDGDPDLALIGHRAEEGSVLALYQNDAGAFAAADRFPAVSPLHTRLLGRDIDGDGRRDLIGMRNAVGGAGAWILMNRHAGFRLYAFDSGIEEGLIAPIDVDQDGIHEFVVCEASAGADTVGIWADDCAHANTDPAQPAGLQHWRHGPSLTLAWDPAFDAETPSAGLEYVLRVGTSVGVADVATVPVAGSDDQLTWTAELDSLEYYYWSVEVSDAAGASSFAAKQVCEAHQVWDEGTQARYSAWADYDADGDWDYVQVLPNSIALRENESGVFQLNTLVGDSVMHMGGFDWADYDGDGDLDLAAGWGRALGISVRGGIFRNESGTLVRTADVLPALGKALPRWGDIDGDGDTDLVVAGTRYPRPGSTWPRVSLLRNAGGVLGPQEVIKGERLDRWVDTYEFADFDLVDYDQDGDLDILLFWSARWQAIVEYYPFSVVLRNDGGTFIQVDNPVGLGSVMDPSTDWADIDADGEPEMAIAGIPTVPEDPGRGVFSVVGGSFGFWSGPQGSLIARFADWDTDGYPELLTNVGYAYQQMLPAANKLFDFQLPGIPDLMILPPSFTYYFGAQFLDFDGDGRLDLVATGGVDRPGGIDHTILISNLCAPPNTPPARPTGLQIVRNGDQVTFSWDPGSDAETPSPGLSYNLMVGSSVGSMDIMPAHSDPQTGRRLLSEPGNVGWRTSWILTIPAETAFYWGVQSIDAGLKGSPFAVMSSDGVPTATEPPARQVRAGIQSVRPNPFNPSTTIEYVLDREQQLRIEVFDARGSRVVVLRDEVVEAGDGTVEWHGRDARGRPVAGGVYFVRLRGESVDDVRKIALVK